MRRASKLRLFAALSFVVSASITVVVVLVIRFNNSHQSVANATFRESNKSTESKTEIKRKTSDGLNSKEIRSASGNVVFRPPITGDEFDGAVSNVKDAVNLYKNVKNIADSRSRTDIQVADLVISSVSVASTKKYGDAWDVLNGNPDIQVVVKKKGFFGSSVSTGIKNDTTYATFNEKTVRVKDGDTIQITVWDSDVLSNDIIGEYQKQITVHTISQGSATSSFGQVLSLNVNFEP